MKNYFIIIIVLFLFSCSKSDLSISGSETLSGQLFWENNLLPHGSQKEPVTKKRVYLSAFPSDSSNYIYYTYTDSIGKFHFTGLAKNQQYLVYFKDTIAGNRYSVYQNVSPSSTHAYILTAQIASKESTGAYFLVSDPNGDPVAKTKIYLYKSRLLAESMDPKGSLHALDTDAFGQALKTGLSEGNWYAYALFDSDSLKLYSIEPFIVNKNKVEQVNIQLNE